MSLWQWLHMGGYAFYVWTAYALAFAILGGNALLPVLQQRAVHRRLVRRHRKDL